MPPAPMHSTFAARTWEQGGAWHDASLDDGVAHADADMTAQRPMLCVVIPAT